MTGRGRESTPGRGGGDRGSWLACFVAEGRGSYYEISKDNGDWGSC